MSHAMPISVPHRSLFLCSVLILILGVAGALGCGSSGGSGGAISGDAGADANADNNGGGDPDADQPDADQPDAGSDASSGEYPVPTATIVSRTSDGQIVLADQVDWHPRHLDLSGDGRFVLFRSRAEQFVEDPSSDLGCILHDAQTGESRNVAPALKDAERCRLSRNGEVVVFASYFEEPNTLYRYDIATGETTEEHSAYSIDATLAISPNARWVVFARKGGPAESREFWLWDLESSQAAAVVPANRVVGVSDSGHVLVLQSPYELDGADFYRPNLYLFDPEDDSMTLVTETVDGEPSDEAESYSYARISPDGAWSTFTSKDTFVDGVDGRRIFVRERASGQWEAISPEAEGEPVQELSGAWGPTPDRRFWFFEVSTLSHTYAHWRWDSQTGASTPYIIGAESNAPHAQMINVSDDGRVAVFLSSDPIAGVDEELPHGVYAYRVELP